MAISFAALSASTQAFLLVSLVYCASSAKLPAVESNQGILAKNGVIVDPHESIVGIGSNPVVGVHSVVPIVASDDLEVVAHTGSEGLGRQKRYVGWGKSPRLRYSKATSSFDHDSLFNRIHNNFDKRGFGPEAPISNFRELRMKQKTPNIQLLLPHLRNTRIPANSPDTDAEDAPGFMINDLDRTGGKLTQEDLDALAYLLEGDMA